MTMDIAERRTRNLQIARDALVGRVVIMRDHDLRYDGLDLSISAASEWDEQDMAQVAEALGVPLDRLDNQWGGCDTCGYGSTLLVVDWAKEESPNALPALPPPPPWVPEPLKPGQRRQAVQSQDGSVVMVVDAGVPDPDDLRWS
jgi:hypothetical protein